jgi:tagatose-1,6-bisphosphate aldolase
MSAPFVVAMAFAARRLAAVIARTVSVPVIASAFVANSTMPFSVAEATLASTFAGVTARTVDVPVIVSASVANSTLPRVVAVAMATDAPAIPLAVRTGVLAGETIWNWVPS